MLADLEVVLSDDAGAAADRAAQLDALAPRDDGAYTSGATFAGTPATLADRLIEEAGDGVARIPPAPRRDQRRSAADRPEPDRRAENTRRPPPRRRRRRHCGLGWAWTRPANRYATSHMSQPRQIHLAAHFPGVNNTTVWSDPAAGSHIDFGSFEQLARTAERAKFDFFFLAEGLRMREHAGRLHELDVAGRPDSLAILAALAAVTERSGWWRRSRRPTTSHTSWRASWDRSTTCPAVAPAGTWSPRRIRSPAPTSAAVAISLRPALRARRTVRRIRRRCGTPAAENGARFAFDGSQVQIAGEFTVPPLPQGYPAMIQAGDSEAGREFAGELRGRDLQPSREAGGRAERSTPTSSAGWRATADIRTSSRSSRGTTFILGDTDAEAHEIADVVRRAQVSGPHAIMFLGQFWNRDLSAYDPDGPLPEVDPDLSSKVRAEGSGPGTDAATRGGRDGGPLACPVPRPTICRSASW